MLMNLLDNTERQVVCDDLVLATPNVSETSLTEDCYKNGITIHTVGDCVAPRWAVHAIYEGRKLGRTL